MQLINKNIGETPLEAIKREFKDDKKRTYAGRLDPMAEGLLLILEGEECKQKEKYLNLDKTYIYEAIQGIQTDSYDLLGKITNVNLEEKKLDLKTGKIILEYPPYSSKTVNGKSLFEYAKEGRLSEIQLPTREVEIYSHKILEENIIKGEEIVKTVEERVKLVKGDFRQKEILEEWGKFDKEYGKEAFKIWKAEIKVSSGTYIRTVASNMESVAFSIKRTEIGEYKL